MMTKPLKLFITSILLFFTFNIFAATFSAQLNVNPVLLSDSFQLTYIAEGSVDDDPDFSPIRKDFDIIGTSQSNNVSMINGDFKRTKKWILSLRAKNSGTFRIPPITFGNEQAPEVEINVKKVAPSNVSGSTQDFIVELETSSKSVFIQEQVILTVRLLIAQNINSYQFSEPRISNSDTIIQALGKDKQYKTYRGTKPYIIIEKQFSIFPQHQGNLVIEPFVAEIGVANRNSRQNMFDPFNSNTTVKRIQSNKVSLNIKAAPKSFTSNNWLPTTSLKLIEQWPQTTKFYAGEPITRTLTLMADGLTASQLPEIKSLSIANLKQYPDKPVLKDNISGKGISSIRTEKIALIPTKAGSYTIPAIDIPWWNTKTNKIDIAHVSSRRITVLASPNSVNNQNSINNQNSLLQNPDTKQSPIINAPISKDVNNAISEESNPLWLWISILFLTLWVSTLFLWWRSRKPVKIKPIDSVIVNQSLKTNLKFLKAACNQNNPQEIKKALINWANIVFEGNGINSLSDIAVLVGEPIGSKITALNSCLYSEGNKSWEAEDLYDLCSAFKVDKNTINNSENSATLESFNAS